MSNIFIPTSWQDFHPEDGLVYTEKGLAELLYPELWHRCRNAYSGVMGVSKYGSYDVYDYGPVGSKYHGTFTGTINWYYDPVFGWVWDVGGSGTNQIGCGDIDASETWTQLSVFAWANPDNTSGKDENVIAKGSGAGQVFGISRQFGSSWEMYMSTTFQVVENVGTPTTGKWDFLGFSWDGSNCRYYVNGVKTGNTDSIGGNLKGSGAALQIGKSDGENPFDGKIASVTIHDRHLTATEIRRMYNCGPRGMYKVRAIPQYFTAPVAPSNEGAALYRHLQNLGVYS